MSRKTRGLRPEERELWQRVAEQSVPMHPERAQPMKQAVEHLNKVPPKHHVQHFGIGHMARKATPQHDLAPPIADHLMSSAIQMDRKAYGKMKRGKLGIEAKIDLHGMTLAQAHPTLNGFIQRTHAQGKRLVLVVTGKGKSGTSGTGPIPERRGVLRQQVPHWLMAPPLGALVIQVTPAHLKHGGEGAYYVYLRRNR